ncbi:MAG: hypothetical protein IT379_25645 [Deltaproteobacteria bacterium]|nr:hypothetical protein [Deltaproteobacteria bacterium]
MTPGQLREAAREWLAAGGDASLEAFPADVHAMSFVVRVADGIEVVAVDTTGGSIHTTCTCGAARCAAQITVLRQIAAGEIGAAEHGRGGGLSGAAPVVRVDAKLMSSSGSLAAVDVRGAERTDDVLSTRLSQALAELLLATVRSGLRGSAAPREEATRSVLALVDERPMTGLRRLLARLDVAVREGDAQRAGLALATVADLVEDFGEARDRRSVGPRLAAALGEPGEVTVVSDRTWVELGRERLPLAGRSRLERRYLVDVKAGTLFAEPVLPDVDVARGGTRRGSAGPSPRTLVVGFGEVGSAGAPAPAWPRQYAVVPDVAPDAWAEIEAAAEREVSAVVGRYRAELDGLGAMAEPACLFAPAEVVEHEGNAVLEDSAGRWIPLARSWDPVACDAFAAAVRGVVVRLVLGRLVHADETVCLLPRSVLVDVPESVTRVTVGPRLIRLA